MSLSLERGGFEDSFHDVRTWSRYPCYTPTEHHDAVIVKQ